MPTLQELPQSETFTQSSSAPHRSLVWFARPSPSFISQHSPGLLLLFSRFQLFAGVAAVVVRQTANESDGRKASTKRGMPLCVCVRSEPVNMSANKISFSFYRSANIIVTIRKLVGTNGDRTFEAIELCEKNMVFTNPFESFSRLRHRSPRRKETES